MRAAAAGSGESGPIGLAADAGSRRGRSIACSSGSHIAHGDHVAACRLAAGDQASAANSSTTSSRCRRRVRQYGGREPVVDRHHRETRCCFAICWFVRRSSGRAVIVPPPWSAGTRRARPSGTNRWHGTPATSVGRASAGERSPFIAWPRLTIIRRRGRLQSPSICANAAIPFSTACARRAPLHLGVQTGGSRTATASVNRRVVARGRPRGRALPGARRSSSSANVSAPRRASPQLPADGGDVLVTPRCAAMGRQPLTAGAPRPY